MKKYTTYISLMVFFVFFGLVWFSLQTNQTKNDYNTIKNWNGSFDPFIQEMPKKVSKKEYSPGGKKWNFVIEEEIKKQNYDKYILSLQEWGKPILKNWKCESCNRRLNEDFVFLDKTDNNIRFKCKCYCDYEHTITLKIK